MAFNFVSFSCLLVLASAGFCIGGRVPSLTPTLGHRVPFVGSRVVGGSDATEGEFPYQVSLQWVNHEYSEHLCGGSIINKRWILTAAHCVSDLPANVNGIFVIKAGKHNVHQNETTEQVAEVESWYSHEEYVVTPNKVAPYDIALIKLKKPLKFNARVKSIALSENGTEHTGIVTLSGWGSISLTNVSEFPSILQKVRIPLIDFQSCNASIVAKYNGVPSPLHETNICTGPLDGGFGSCFGDSGGALIQTKADGEREVVGIASWIIPSCGSVGSPSVFVKVSAFIDWIADTIAKHAA